MDNDILTAALAALSTLATAGLAGVTASVRKTLAPLRGRRTLKVCLVCDVSIAEACIALRGQLKAAGYREVSVTHTPVAAGSADAVVLIKPARETAGEVVKALRLASPLAYLLVFTQERLDVTIDDRSLLSNSRLRLLSDLGVVAEAFAADAVGAVGGAS